jgi:F1F0 ATPase subunit 2
MEQIIWSTPFGIVGPFIVGLALGLFYFAGLWLTLSRLTQTGNLALLCLASFAGRMMVLIGGIYLISNGQWQRIAACLAGVVLMRVLLTRHLAPRTAPATHVRR